MTGAEDLADQLIACPPGALAERVAALRPQLSSETVAALKARVDAAKLRNARRALAIADVAATVAEALADPGAVALAAWARGNALYHLSHYAEALASYRCAEDFYVNSNADFEAACVQINQVAVLQDTGAFAEALAIAARARSACERLGPRSARLLAILEMNSGAAYQQLARPDEALAAYARGRALLVELDDPIETARIDINRANVLQEMGRFGEAEALYRAARAALAAADAQQEVAKAEHNLGKLAYRRGRYQEALAHLEAARAGFAAIPNPIEAARADLFRALVYRDLNLLAETLALAAEAAESFRRAGTAWELAVALGVEGTARARLGDPSGAAELLGQARRLLRRQGALARLPALDLERAGLAHAAGQPDLARRLARQAARQIDPGSWPGLAARAELLLAACDLDDPRPRPTLARRHAEAALALTTRYGLPEQAQAQHSLARAQIAAGAAEAGVRSLGAAVAAAEELRQRLPVDDLQLAYLEQQRAIYQDAARAAFAAGEPAGALAALNLALSAPTPRPPSAYAPAEAARLAELRERWAWLQSQLEGVEEQRGADSRAHAALDQERRQIEAAMADLTMRHEARTGLPADGPGPIDPLETAPASLAALQARLAPGAALLAYAPLGPRLDALLITRESAELLPGIADTERLRRLLRSWRFHIEHGYAATPAPAALSAARAHLSQLHAALIAPLAGRLDGLRRLYLVAPPEWHDLPLAAAFDGRAYLAERLEVAHLSAPAALPGPDAPAPAVGPALVVGCSDGGRLPAALAEAATVAEALRARRPARLLLERQAGLAAVRAELPTAGLIHLAAHAGYRPDNPRFSWVQLADARLAVADLAELRLAGRPLVVLSACETGRGRPFGGGLLGMGRATLLAGASALVVSLWKIADRSSAQLMADFYAADPEADPVAALARAQNAAIGRGEHPFHWAAFICVQG